MLGPAPESNGADIKYIYIHIYIYLYIRVLFLTTFSRVHFHQCCIVFLSFFFSLRLKQFVFFTKLNYPLSL